MGSEDEVGRGTVRRTVGPLGDPETVGWWETLWRPFWALPAAILGVTVVAGAAIPRVDEHLLGDVVYLFGGNADSARSLLSTIASAMISVTGLVFSITMVVMQLASSQFTPRLLGSFLGSRVVQVTLGVFTASFVFALMVLRDVRAGDSPFVPRLSVTLAFALVMASVGLFLAFIHHITDSIQVTEVVDRVAVSTVRSLERGSDAEWDDTSAVPPSWSQQPGPSVRVTTGERHGVVQRIHYSHLATCAERAGVVIELVTRAGEVRHRGQELARFTGRTPTTTSSTPCGRPSASAGSAPCSRTRSSGCASSSTSRNVPSPPASTTRRRRSRSSTSCTASCGSPRSGRTAPPTSSTARVVRVVDRPPTFAGMLDLAVDEIAHYGADTLQVPRRIEALLDDLERMARTETR